MLGTRVGAAPVVLWRQAPLLLLALGQPRDPEKPGCEASLS